MVRSQIIKIAEILILIEKDKKYGLTELIKRGNFGFEPHPNWKGHVELQREIP